MQVFFLPRNQPRGEALARIIRAIHALPADRLYAVEIKERKRGRTLQQNAYLWGVCYAEILRQGGESLAGWEAEDIHEYMLGEWSGWEELGGFGRKRLRPVKRSSTLSVTEFMDYVDFIHRKAAELGIVIPDPNEELAS